MKITKTATIAALTTGLVLALPGVAQARGASDLTNPETCQIYFVFEGKNGKTFTSQEECEQFMRKPGATLNYDPDIRPVDAGVPTHYPNYVKPYMVTVLNLEVGEEIDFVVDYQPDDLGEEPSFDQYIEVTADYTGSVQTFVSVRYGGTTVITSPDLPGYVHEIDPGEAPAA